jgi:hypothetical protein
MAVPAATEALQVPRVSRRLKGQIEVDPAIARAVFPRIELAEQDRAGCLKLVDGARVIAGDVIHQHTRGPAGAHALRVVVVFDRKGQAMQRPSPAARLNVRLGLPGGRARRVGHHEQVAMNLVVHRLDAAQIGLGEIDRRQLARLNQAAGVAC